MGYLNTHNVAGLIGKYGLSAFVETGLYKGEGLAHAASFPQFKKLVSIDILPQWIAQGQKTFGADDRITLLLGNSYEVMSEALSVVEGHSTIWWLDAHLPESCMSDKIEVQSEMLGNKIYDDATTFPLDRELRAITADRDFTRDVFLIDDLRLYENGEYRWGNWNARDKYNAPRGAGFVFELLSDSHLVTRGSTDHGFISAEPKIREMV